MRFREPIDRAKLEALRPKPGQKVRWGNDGREYTVQAVGMRYLYLVTENGYRFPVKINEVTIV